MKTIRDPGELSLEGMYESADLGQVALSAAFAASSNQLNGAAYPFKLVLPINLNGGQLTTGDTSTFNGLVTDFALSDVEKDKELTFKATIKLTGSGTFVEGA
jgi:hypothetical protein